MSIKRDLILIGLIENLSLSVLFTAISGYVLFKKRKTKMPDTPVALTWFFF